MRPDCPTLLTRNQLAEILNICRRTIQRLERTGEFKPVRIGRAVRYRLEDVQAFIDSQVGRTKGEKVISCIRSTETGTHQPPHPPADR